jgi:hypothetical protein
MSELGVQVPPGVNVGRIDMDSAWAVELLERIGRAFADRIDFDDPAGLDLGSSSYPYARRLP